MSPPLSGGQRSSGAGDGAGNPGGCLGALPMVNWVPLRLRAPGSGTKGQGKDDWSSSSIKRGDTAILSSSPYEHPAAHPHSQAHPRGPAVQRETKHTQIPWHGSAIGAF